MMNLNKNFHLEKELKIVLKYLIHIIILLLYFLILQIHRKLYSIY